MLDHKYRKTVLDNGFEVHSLQIPNAEKTYLEVRIKSGSACERPGQYGVAHYLEHMLGYGSEQYGENDLLPYFINKGGLYNFTTNYFYTNYYAYALPAKVFEYLERISTVLTRPAFTERQVDMERNPILSERRTYEDESRFNTYIRGQTLLYPDHRISQPILGTKEDIQKISFDDLMHYYESVYVAPNMFLVAAGAVDHEHLVRNAELLFSTLPTRSCSLSPQKMDFIGGSHTSYMDTQALEIVAGFEALPRCDSGTDIESILTQTLSRRLHENLRDEKKLVYDARASLQRPPGQSFLAAVTSLDPQHVSRATEVIFDTFEDFAQNFGKKDIEKFQAGEEETLAEYRHSPKNNGEYLAEQISTAGRYHPLSQEMDVSRSTSIEGFREAIHAMFSRKFYFLAVGPETKIPDINQHIDRLRSDLGIVSITQRPYMVEGNKPTPM